MVGGVGDGGDGAGSSKTSDIINRRGSVRFMRSGDFMPMSAYERKHVHRTPYCKKTNLNGWVPLEETCRLTCNTCVADCATLITAAAKAGVNAAHRKAEE